MVHSRDVYYLTAGTLQPVIMRESPHFMHFFGLSEHDAQKPVLKERHIARAGPICDRLNAGEITEAEAIKSLENAL